MYTPSKTSPGWSLYDGSESKPTLPPEVFKIAWFVVYACMATGSFLYERDCKASSNFSVVIQFAVANILSNKLWTVAFFEYGLPWISLAIAVWLLVSASFVANRVLDDTSACPSTTTAVAVMWIASAVWYAFAVVLNTIVAWRNCRRQGTTGLDGSRDIYRDEVPQHAYTQVRPQDGSAPGLVAQMYPL